MPGVEQQAGLGGLRKRMSLVPQPGVSKPPHLANLSWAKFTFGGRVATDHRMHTWRFAFKLGRRMANHAAPGDVRPLSKPIRTQCESPLHPFCLCYRLF
ncbi:hypothetical protein E2C01_052446 [Portunus trituberculatus]|uniref:Uncharacterized protein n=1 Tax=Portunus trituberculatus TaxID=210409 RepID=A0A5B7GEJ9_PORTR|nr:hypothetical protein [Portunus trituberculatus]